jgi:indole-3-glycerol phosphate synthase
MTGLLTTMAQSSLERLRAAEARESERALWNRVSELPPAPRLTLCSEGFDLIAECKLHSPSAGDLSAHTKAVETRVSDYARGGAAAISILTEPTKFGGALEHLERASRVLAPLGVPTMRKDFLVDPYQVMEARAAGASGVLVIVRMLDRSRIHELIDCAAMLQMFVLLEAFDAADLEMTNRILETRKRHDEQILVGLNCRDLDTLTVDLERLVQLFDELPQERPRVAESGVLSLSDVERVAGIGYELALVGSALMGTPEPCRLVGDMLAAGRRRALELGARNPRDGDAE